jgi:hypothetical protein
MPLVRMHRQWASNLEPDELSRQLQDIPEEEPDANGNEDEDYEPSKVAGDSSSDCDAEDSCRLEEELEDDVQQQVMPAMNVGQAGCSTRRRAQQEEIEEEAQEELSSWGILLTRSMLAKIMKQSGLSLRVGGVHSEDLEATTCSGKNQARHHMPHGVSQRTKSLRPGNFSLMIQSFVTSSVAQKLNRAGEQNWSLVIEELDAFIALVYAQGAYGCRSVDCDVLWNVNWGPPVFPDTMSRNKFREIMRYLRFDPKRTRSQLLLSDKFALASEVLQRFIDNCFLCYRPEENLTADEQIFPSKARCRFTQYMANKPDKFGIKF